MLGHQGAQNLPQPLPLGDANKALQQLKACETEGASVVPSGMS